MKDYRAATWAVMATILTVLAAVGAIPATAAILGLAAGCSALAFLHAVMHPRTETVEVQLGVVNVQQAAPPNELERFMQRIYGGDYANRNPGAGSGVVECPVHGPNCSSRG